jgi:hypothetical protein
MKSSEADCRTMVRFLIDSSEFLSLPPATRQRQFCFRYPESPKVRKSQIVGSKSPLFASPSLTVCRPLQLVAVTS